MFTTCSGITVLEILLSTKSPFEVLSRIGHYLLALLVILLLVADSCKLFLFLYEGVGVR